MTVRPFFRLPPLPGPLRRTLPLVLALSLLPAWATAQTGSITGTVTGAAGGAPLAGVQVLAVYLDQTAAFAATTNGSGAYTIASLRPGAYYVFTSSNPTGHVNQVYGGLACPGTCPSSFVSTGTPVVVAPGGTTTGVDVALIVGGAVTGRVTRAADGTGVSGQSVTAYTRVGSSVLSVGNALTSPTGAYTLTGLPSGTYYLATVGTNSLGLINEIYDGIQCLGSCSSTAAAATGTPVGVTAGGVTPDRDFSLEEGGRVTGTITDVATATGIQSVSVSLYTLANGSATFVGSATTDSSGSYTVQGLPTGAYFAMTSNNAGYMNEIYDNLLCVISCSSSTAVASGAAIPVTQGATTSGRNFALAMGGTVTGTITNAQTATPVTGTVYVYIEVNGVAFGRSAAADASGVYTVRGLPTGTYYAFTSVGGGLVNEIYDDIPCYDSCFYPNALRLGAPIPVTAGATTTGRDFALSPGGGIFGSVTDAVTGQPPAGSITVSLYAVAGSSFTYAGNIESTSGSYGFGGLLPGQYVLVATNRLGYLDELYDNIPCWWDCDFTSGTRVTVTAGTTVNGRNFALSPGGTITGTVTDEVSGSPLPGVLVSVHARSASGSATASTNAAGVYTVRGLPSGEYVAYTSTSAGYVNEIYDNIACSGTCSSTTARASGTPITVAGLTTGVDFALAPQTGAPGAPSNFRATGQTVFGLQFTWNAPSLALGGSATSYVLEVGFSPGTTALTLPVASGTSYTASGVPPGTYYVRVRGVNGAGTGPASAEIVVQMTGSGAAPVEAPINVAAFASGNLLTLTWADATSGGVPTGYVVEAGSATGLSNIATIPVTSRAFTYQPVPNGFYFLRVRARNAAGLGPASAERMLVVGGVPSPPGPPNFSSASVTGSTVTLNWVAPAVGSPTSYIVEAGSATGLSNLAVVNTGSSAVNTSFTGVPSGTYYVRLRAVNALGASVVSNERTVIVP